MRDKRGDLLNNILTTVIAVVGLAIILFAGWQLYSVYSSQEEKNAQTLIDTVEAKISAIEDGETARFVVGGVKGWFVTGWDLSESDRPDKCAFNSCVCVCPGGKTSTANQRMGEICQEGGFCRDVSADNLIMHVTEYAYYLPSIGKGVPPEPVTERLTGIFFGADQLYELSASRQKGAGEMGDVSVSLVS